MTISGSPILGIMMLVCVLIFVCIMYYYQSNRQYDDQYTQTVSTFSNLYSGFRLIGFMFCMIILITIIFLSMTKKENMTNSTISSTDPMVISQTTAGAIKMIHDQLAPIQITQELIDQLKDQVNDQSDQISTLQANSAH
jgi:uncharacterized membrane protein